MSHEVRDTRYGICGMLYTLLGMGDVFGNMDYGNRGVKCGVRVQFRRGKFHSWSTGYDV